MSHYAVMVSGGLANSLSQFDVGNRSVTCLGFEGSVYFPYTFDEMQAGVSFAIPTGNYTIKIIGFSGSQVASPATLAQTFAESPSLKAYLLAQGNKNTTGGGSASLAATYNATTSPDLIAGCPPLAQNLHAIAYDNGHVYYLKGASNGASWQTTTLGNTDPVDNANLEIDQNGKVHITYSDSYTSSGVRYTTNESGSFSNTEALSITSTGGYDNTAILFDSTNTLLLAANRMNASYATSVYQKGASAFNYSDDAILQAGFHYSDMDMALGPNGRIALAAVESSTGSPVRVVEFTPGVGWLSKTTISDAGGGNPCTSVEHPTVTYNANGAIFVSYKCNTVTTPIAGLAHTAYAIWTKTAVASYTTTGNAAPPSIAIDSGNTLHFAWADRTALYYRKADADNVLFDSPQNVAAVSGLYEEVQIQANGVNDVKIFTTNSAAVNYSVKVTLFNGSLWATQSVFSLATQLHLGRGIRQQ